MVVISLMDYNDSNIRRELIMKHYSTPHLKSTLKRNDIDAYSNHCVDELHIQWEFEGDILKKANWDGQGCAVFQSSSDIFLLLSIGKSKKEIKELAINYENLINNNNEIIDESMLKDLMIYKNVKTQLNRLDCANMISQAILKIK